MRDIDARLYADAISLNPQVVILQTGYNDAAANLSADEFYTRLARMVADIRRTSSVVLMSPQYTPRSPATLPAFLAAMDRVSAEQSVPIIDRYGYMKQRIDGGLVAFSDVLFSDNLHPNDAMYRCTAQIAAELIGTASLR